MHVLSSGYCLRIKLTTLVLKGYADRSIFVRADWDNAEFTKDKTGMKVEDAVKLVQGQMRYILHDPHISKGRKLLVIEQFRNTELAEQQTKQNYELKLRTPNLMQNGYYRPSCGLLTPTNQQYPQAG